ncbi:hypothetical protein Tco_1223087 [Tanacetum coccineum]
MQSIFESKDWQERDLKKQWVHKGCGEDTREIVECEEKEIDENILSTEDVLSTDKEKVSTDKEKVSTDRPIVSTDGSKVSTDKQRKGTEDHTGEGSATQATQTPTSTIFGDDETIAKVLLNMSQAKAVSREKEKGVEKIQEEWEGEVKNGNRIAEEKATNEALIRNFDDIKARIEADRLLAEKLQEQEREQFTIEERAKFLHDTIAAQRKFLAQQRPEVKGKTNERLIKRMNEKGIDSFKSEVIKEESKEEVQEESKEEESTKKRKLGTRKKMKSRKRRFIQNTLKDDSEKENDCAENYTELYMKMSFGIHSAGLANIVSGNYLVSSRESEEDNTMALELIRFIKKLLAELEPEDFDGDEEDL